MKKFLAIYIGTEETMEKSGWTSLGKEEREKRDQQGMDAWMAWGKENAKAIVDMGTPLGTTKRASRAGSRT